MLRSIFWLIVIGAILVTAFRNDSQPADQAPDEHRFRKKALSGNLSDLVDMDIAANGDVYFIGHDGSVYVYRKGSQSIRRIVKLDVQTSEAMLQAIALAPDFAQSSHVYLLYAPKKPKEVNQVSRFTIQDDTIRLASEKVIISIPDTWSCCHSGGAMAFDKHDNLYITTGDNTNPFGTNYAPIDERPGRVQYDAQRTSANTQDLRGKILRIHPEPDGAAGATPYSIPKGNLFIDPKEGRPEIYIMGCRNPFRVTVDRDTDLLYWSEVGPDASDTDPRGPRGYDELNQAREAGNHGWPLLIGNNEPYAKVDFKTDSILFRFDPMRPVNLSVNNTGARYLPPARPPLIWYPYDASAEFPTFGTGGRTLVAGPIYYYDATNPSLIKFPAYFDRKLLLGEWMRNWIKVVSLDENKQVKAIDDFMPSTPFRKPISMKFGPDGALYLIEFGSLWGGNRDSQLSRIEYIAGNRPPVASLQLNTDAGAAPLRVQLSAANSLDYDDHELLTYQWFVNGKLLPVSEPISDYVFTKAGNYRVKLVVKDKAGAQAAAEQQISVGNNPPEVRIVLAQKGNLYGSAVRYKVVVSDTEDGDNRRGRIQPENIQLTMRRLPTSKAVSQTKQGVALSPFYRGATWIEESDCKGCHALNAKSAGPSFQAIAERYEARRQDPALIEQLRQKILKGGYGNWGDVNMSAHPQLSSEVVNEMVRYILSLNPTETVAQKLPASGEITTDPTKPGTIILNARYTDRGRGNAKPLTRETTIVLRSPVLEARDFDETYELQKQNNITDVHKGAYFTIRDVDLTGIKNIVFTLATETPGTHIEVRADSPDGELLGELAVPVTGKWKDWKEQTLPLKSSAGKHTLYFVFENRLNILNLVEIRQLRFGN